MHIKNWPEGDRPREMLLEKGPEALSDAALLAILLKTGRQGKNAIALAREMIRNPCATIKQKRSETEPPLTVRE